MNRARSRFLAGLALLALLAAWPDAAGAQEEIEDDTVPIQQVDVADHPTVVVDFSAPPTFVEGELTAEEVRLLENGEPRDFEIEVTDADNLEVVLAIDTSGSMNANNALAEAKRAVQAFVERVPQGTRMAVLAFGEESIVVTEFTTDKQSVTAAVDGLVARGETALYDGVLEAVRLFLPADDVPPRYVVLVSDGGDTVSESELGTAQAAVQAANIPVVAVSLVTTESDPEALAGLTTDAGGTVVEATDPVALADVYDQIASTITVQYQLRYQSQATGRTQLRIELARNDATAIGTIGVNMPLPPPEPTPTPTAEPTVEATPTPRGPIAAIVVTPPNRSWLLPTGIVLVSIGLLILFGYLLWPARRRRNLLKELAPGAGNVVKASGGLLAGVSRTLVRAVESGLTSRDEEGELAQRLDRAGIRMRPAEYLITTVLAAIVAGLVGLFISGAAAVIFALLAVLASFAIVTVIGERRASEFEEQMATTLQMMSGALRAGFSISQVVDLVAREASSPTRDEFARLSVEENLGRDISDSFRDVAARMKSEDFAWVAEAIDINRTVGGDLSEVLENVSETIRTRQSIHREIKTLSAEGRLSALILIAVPFIIFGGQFLINPALSEELYGTSAGRVLIVIGLVMIGIGSLWMRRIVRLKY